MKRELLEFYTSFNEDVNEQMRRGTFQSKNAAFKSLFVPYLTERDYTELGDVEYVEFKKDSMKIRLDGYVYSEFNKSLTLLVSDYNQRKEPVELNKLPVTEMLKMPLTFFKKCLSKELEVLEESSQGYQAYTDISKLKHDIILINVILITNNIYNKDVPNDTGFLKYEVRYDVWDLERIYQIIFAKGDAFAPKITDFTQFGEPFPMIKVPGSSEIYDCYVGSISGSMLAQIYDYEGQDLIQKNVRSFLQFKGKVNKGIRQSIIENPGMFMAYNNGISTTADSIATINGIEEDGIIKIKTLSNWQIVNGGQTTAALYFAFKEGIDLSKIHVQMKLSVIKKEDALDPVAKRISFYANSQNKITMSDFNANDNFHVGMEKFSRQVAIPSVKGKSIEHWFYERVRGQYYVELNRLKTEREKNDFKRRFPKERVVSKTVTAKAVMAYDGFPSSVCKGLETNFHTYSGKISAGEIPAPSESSYIEMIGKLILFNEIDKIVKAQNFTGYKSQINAFTLALLGKYHSDKVDFTQIWKDQKLSKELEVLISSLVYEPFDILHNPPKYVKVNITSWTKNPDCWNYLQKKYEERIGYKPGKI